MTRIHGHQEGRSFHGFYGAYCFLPLYVFCGEQFLVSYLRPSNRDAAAHSWAILKLLSQRLRAAWPEVRIIFRGDSGFCRWKMLRWCERHEIGYIVGLAKNARLLAASAQLLARAHAGHCLTAAKQRCFAWLDYGALTWDRRRCVIAKVEYSGQGANPRFARPPYSLPSPFLLLGGD